MTYVYRNRWAKGAGLLDSKIKNNKVFKLLNIISVFAMLANASLAGFVFMPRQATAATVPLVMEDFESYAAGAGIGSPWTQQNGVLIQNENGGKAAELEGDDDERFWTSITTSGYQTIKVSYDRKTTGIENDDDFYAQWRVGTSGDWTNLENLTSNSGWTTKQYTLPSSANNKPTIQIRFRMDGSSSNDKAYVDNINVTGESTTVEAVPNPALGQSCGLDIALVIDSSGSIDGSELTLLKNAYNDFVDQLLPSTPTQMSVTEFDDTASVKQGFTANPALLHTAVNNASSGGWTNWEDGLIKAASTFDPRPAKSNLVLFASDGNPNTTVTQPNGSAGETAALAAAVTQANAIKTAGTRIVALGIGNELDVDNLKAISGPNVAPPAAVNENSDVVLTNFDTLGATLASIANALCGGKILVQKQFDTDGNGSVDVDGNTPNAVLAGWTFDVNGTPTNPAPQTTTDSGYLEFPVQNGSHYSIAETNQKPGTSLASTVCVKGQTPVNAADFAINTDETVSCTFVNKTNTYKLRVKKDVDTDGDGHVNFYHVTDWTWDILNGAQNIPTTNGDVWQTLPAGTYTISEDQKPGYQAANLTCIEHGNNNFEHSYGAVESAAINLTNGDQTCIFTNHATTGTLIVKKVVSGSDVGPSAWMIHVKKDNQEVAGSPAAGTTSGTSYTLLGGSYVVSETGGPAGYTASFSESCPNGAATVTPGQTTICTITNTRDTGSIKVNKKVDADANGSFEGTNTQANALGFDWGLDGVTPNRDMGTTASPVTTGDHTVTENSVANYHFVGWYPTGSTQYSCANPKGTTLPITLSVVKGQTNEITLCNVRDSGRITFDKVVVGGTAQDKDFTFTVNSGTYKDGDTATFLTGSYSLTESQVTGYTMTGATGACSLGPNGVTLTVTTQGGTCTITNTRDTGTLIVHKDVKNPDGGAVSDTHPFFVKLNGADQKTIAEGTDATYANLPTGTYTVTENPDGDYTWHSWSVDANNNQSGAQVVVTKGQTTHLTVVNKQKKADIKIKKDVRDAQGANISDNTSFSVTWEGQSFTIRENDSETVHVNPGTYNFTEGVNPNYTIHSTNPKSITVGSNGYAEYTFENWKKPPLTISATKLVCDNESDLPDWGRTNPAGPNITASTAQDWINTHPGCRLEQGWSFQWGDENASNPGDNTGATGNSHWHTFGPTNGSGVATVQIADIGSNDKFWMREVWKNDYIPFDGAINTTQKKVSAEMYCSTDVVNYDNYDYIENPTLGNTYHCVAFNVRKTGDITGSKFNDINGNGSWNESEPGLSGWTIKLWQGDALLDTTVTDANGHYSFTHLPTGTYAVSEEMQGGWMNTTTNPVTNVSVAYNQKTTVNFGNFKKVSVTACKVIDYGDEETGSYYGWPMYLITDGQTATEASLTNDDGCVTWSNLGPQHTYGVQEGSLFGYTPLGDTSVDFGQATSGQEYSHTFTNQKNTFNVSVEKSANKEVAEAGSELVYTLSWSATGNTPVEVNLFDLVPANTTFLSADNGGYLDGSTVRWNIGTVNPYANGQVSFTVTVNSPLYNGTQIQNTGNVCGLGAITEGEPFFSQGEDMRRQKCDDDTITTWVHSDFGLTVDKKAAETVDAGGQLTFTIDWSVTGNSPVNQVIVTDTLPANVSYVSSDNGGVYDNPTNTVTWNLGAHLPGDSGTVALIVQVASPLTKGTELVNNASACGSTDINDGEQVLRVVSVIDEETPSHCAYDKTTTIVQSAPVLGITKTNDKSPVNPLDTVNYKVSWSVAGNANATVVTLTDTLPTQIELVAGTISDSGTYNAATRTITWNLGTQSPGASGFVTYTAKVNSPLANGTTIINTAKISSAETDPIFYTAQSQTVVTSKPVLTIDKVVNVTFANPGDTVKYTVTITNTGTDAAHNVTLSDTLPAGLLFKDTLTPSKSFSLGELAAGSSIVTSYDVLVGANVAAGLYDNLATATADNHAAVKDTARLEVRVPVVLGETTPTMSLVKTVDVKSVNPKGTAKYTVTIQNTGSAVANNVKLTDTLPAGFTFEDGTTAKTWTIGTLGIGESKTLTYKVKVSAKTKSGIYENLAVVNADGTGPVEARAQIQVKVPRVLGATVETGASARDLMIFAASILMIALGIVFLRRGRELV